jgi:cobalt transporter subunit CbtA
LQQVGFGLIMIAAMRYAAERGATINARNGLLWGFAGYIAFHFAPAFSLPPEVPGAAHVDLGQRQIWWWGTAGASAIAMALIGFGKTPPMWAAAVVLLLAPHVIGAPQPDVFAGPVPPEIAALYAARALGVGLAAWLMLGLFAGYFWVRETAQES